MATGMTAEQRLMAREMSDLKHTETLQATLERDGTVRLGEVLDEVIGVPASDVEVTQEAWNIINEHGEGLVLGFKEWAIVQKLVEAGIVSGRAGS